MKTKIFNKYVAVLLVLILLFATGIKIRSTLTAPYISNWNLHKLEKIDHSKKNFSFAVFGDNRNSIFTFNDLISQLNKENLLFSIDVGDLVLDGDKTKFQFFIKQIENVRPPLLTAYGNHEAWGNGRNRYIRIFGPLYYSFSVGDNYFIILDDSNERSIDNKQYIWLKKELKISQKYKNRFVFMHVPLYDPRGANNSMIFTGHGLKDQKFTKKLNNLFDKNKVTMLFCAHIHGYFRGRWGKTPYIITGGAGAPLKGLDPNHYFYHHIKVNVNNNGLAYSVIKTNSFVPNSLIGRGIYDIFVLYVYYYFELYFWQIILFGTLIYFGCYIVFTYVP